MTGWGGVPKQRVGAHRIVLIRAQEPRNKTISCIGQGCPQRGCPGSMPYLLLVHGTPQPSTPRRCCRRVPTEMGPECFSEVAGPVHSCVGAAGCFASVCCVRGGGGGGGEKLPFFSAGGGPGGHPLCLFVFPGFPILFPRFTLFFIRLFLGTPPPPPNTTHSGEPPRGADTHV